MAHQNRRTIAGGVTSAVVERNIEGVSRFYVVRAPGQRTHIDQGPCEVLVIENEQSRGNVVPNLPSMRHPEGQGTYGGAAPSAIVGGGRWGQIGL